MIHQNLKNICQKGGLEPIQAKNNYGMTLSKVILNLFQTHSKPIPNPFQNRHLKLVIWTYEQIDQLWQRPNIFIKQLPLGIRLDHLGAFLVAHQKGDFNPFLSFLGPRVRLEKSPQFALMYTVDDLLLEITSSRCKIFCSLLFYLVCYSYFGTTQPNIC